MTTEDLAVRVYLGPYGTGAVHHAGTVASTCAAARVGDTMVLHGREYRIAHVHWLPAAAEHPDGRSTGVHLYVEPTGARPDARTANSGRNGRR